MKKTIAILLAALLVFTMAACGKELKQELGGTAEGGGNMVGAWEVTEDGTLTEEAKAALEKALVGFAGAGYEPIALLATQLVSGTNYCILCKGTLTTQDALQFCALVYVYEDLEGNAKIIDIADIDIAATSDAESAVIGTEFYTSQNSTFVGAWAVMPETAVTEELKAVFDKAMEGFTGVGYEPAACLASQVVAGRNYCFLAKATQVTSDAAQYWTLVYIYNDLDGGAQIMNIVPVDITGFGMLPDSD